MKRISVCVLALVLCLLGASSAQAGYRGGFRGFSYGYGYRSPIVVGAYSYGYAPLYIQPAPLVVGAYTYGPAAYTAPPAYSADTLPVLPAATVGYLQTQPDYIQSAYLRSTYGASVGTRLHTHHFGPRGVSRRR